MGARLLHRRTLGTSGTRAREPIGKHPCRMLRCTQAPPGCRSHNLYYGIFPKFPHQIRDLRGISFHTTSGVACPVLPQARPEAARPGPLAWGAGKSRPFVQSRMIADLLTTPNQIRSASRPRDPGRFHTLPGSLVSARTLSRAAFATGRQRTPRPWGARSRAQGAALRRACQPPL